MFQAVKMLIEQCEADPDARTGPTRNKLNALHAASENGQLETVKYLVEKVPLSNVGSLCHWP